MAGPWQQSERAVNTIPPLLTMPDAPLSGSADNR